MQVELVSKNGQTIFDIALMTYGSLDSVYTLISQNEIDNINDPLPNQKSFTFDSSAIVDLTVYNAIATRLLIYNTDQNFNAIDVPINTGGVYDDTYDVTYN